MVRNQSKTTCNLPETLVGHSKITINLLNSAWFGRYSGFLVWIYLGYQHTECCGWWGGGIMRNITSFFSVKKSTEKKIDEKKSEMKKFCPKKNQPKKNSTKKLLTEKIFNEKIFDRKKLSENFFVRNFFPR